MLGPVGMRCRDCGKPAYDPLTSFTPKQVALGLAMAVIGGTIAAFIASRIGFFSIFVSFFAGGFMWGYLWCSLRVFREMAALVEREQAVTSREVAVGAAPPTP